MQSRPNESTTATLASLKSNCCQLCLACVYIQVITGLVTVWEFAQAQSAGLARGSEL